MKNVFLRAAPIWLAVMAGCASVPDAPAPFPVISQQYSAAQARASGPGDLAALDEWWRLFNDPYLDDLVTQALRESTEARMTMARLREARSIRDAALTQYRLQGGLRAGGERRGSRKLGGSLSGAESAATGLGAHSSASLDMQVSWELDLFGRGAAHGQQVDGEFRAVLYDTYAQRAALVAEVARTLFEVQRLTAALSDAKATVSIQTKLRDLLARKVSRGLAPSSEVARVEAGLLSAQADEWGLDAQLNATRRALLVLVGMGDESLEAVQVSGLQAQAPALPQGFPAELLVRRPDVLKARAQMDAASGSLELSRLALLPSITLTPGLGASWQNQRSVLSSGYWSLAGNVFLPVLDRPRLLANARAQGARAEQAVIGYEQVVQRAFSEADQAMLRMAPDRQRLEALEKAQGHAHASYESALKGYGAGFFDLLVVLDAELAYRQARVALTTAKADALGHAVQVFQALGGGWSPASRQDEES